MVYQFTVHKNLPENSACPIDPMFQLYGKLQKGKQLSRKEKDHIAESLYGVSGMWSSVYKRGGFAAHFSTVLQRYLVYQRHYGWLEYYAPDKTSLRKAIFGGIIEIIKA